MTRLFVNEHFTKKKLRWYWFNCVQKSNEHELLPITNWALFTQFFWWSTQEPVVVVVYQLCAKQDQAGWQPVGTPTTWAHIHPTSTATDFLTLQKISHLFKNRNDHSLTYSISPMQTNCVGTLQPGQIYTNNTPTDSDFWTILDITLYNRTRAIQ